MIRFRIPQYGALLDASPVGQMLQQMLIGVDAAAATWHAWLGVHPAKWNFFSEQIGMRCLPKVAQMPPEVQQKMMQEMNKPANRPSVSCLEKEHIWYTHTHTIRFSALFVHAMTGITGIFSLRSWLPVWQWDIWPTFSQRLMQRSGSTWGQPFGWTGEPCNSQNLRSHETPVNACWSTGTRMRILTCQCRPGWVNSQVDSEREEARNP